jgi:NAD-dependent DNA ligase
MTKKEKLELYYKAKEAYYNGQEIMTDYEFDMLEKELGLENKSHVGARHNPSYTQKHPFVMGSLSKVQVHKDKEGNIDWKKYFTEAAKYFGKHEVIITPKFDGCSFECEINDDKLMQISSRGDGEYGKDLTLHLVRFIPESFYQIHGHNVFRGEVLVNKKTYAEKYVEQFTNPRSFVSGVLNRDYSEDEDFYSMRNDLSLMFYDYRQVTNGLVKDYDWTKLNTMMTPSDLAMGVTPSFFKRRYILNENDFEEVYNQFADYRKLCPFALDGFVIKPIEDFRINNTTERRPSDCVAIKFVPMLEETEVVNITWNLGKTGEYTPIIWVKPVEMDGRMVAKCSGHNLGYLKEKGITIGAKIIMSLAGDIIPFMYKVTQENIGGTIPMPTDHEYYEDDIHLMAVLSENDRRKYKFINSINTLNIPTVGGQTAKEIFEYLENQTDEITMDFFGEEKKDLPFNVLLISPEDMFFALGSGKSGKNAEKAFKEILDNITLNDIIKSCNFKFCGGKVTEQVVKYFLNDDPDFSHLASEGFNWIYDENSEQYKELMNILNHLGKTFDDFKTIHQEATKTASTQIPVILTGEPNNYKSKGEFLKLNPQYRNTGSWKEVQIVFTNSLDSNTGKMKKAREKNIKIELY